MKEFTHFFVCKYIHTFYTHKTNLKYYTFINTLPILFNSLHYTHITKKLIVSRQPILINLKSNTMKNTTQK